MKPKVAYVEDVKEGYWVVLRLMRMLSRDPVARKSEDFNRTLAWLLDGFEYDVLSEAIGMLEADEWVSKHRKSKQQK